MRLNQEQFDAVHLVDGAVCVVAGPGTGKTHVLTHRFAHLVDQISIPAENILCVTFTNKAANEMKRRISGLVGETALPYVSTFHSFCARFFREEYNTIGFPPGFSILDKADSRDLMKAVLTQNQLNVRDLDMSLKKALHEFIEKPKGKRCFGYPQTLTDNLQALDFTTDDIEERIFVQYLYAQRKAFRLDFNDLLYLCLDVLENNRAVREKWQQRMQFVMVDEFQDVSKTQHALALLLAEKHQNLFVVGDPDQTIYTFRGAKIERFLEFSRQPTVQTLFLTANYRSSAGIINAANTLIAKNKKRIPKDLVPFSQSAGKPIFTHFPSPDKEAAFIAGEIKRLHTQGAAYHTMAILYRAHHISRAFEEHFRAGKIPYKILSGTAFYERKEIKDVLAYLQLVASDDDIAFRRIVNSPKRGIGEKTLERIESVAKAERCSLLAALQSSIPTLGKPKASALINAVEAGRKEVGSVSAVLHRVLVESGYEEAVRESGDEETLENLSELRASVLATEEAAGELFSLRDYLDQIALFVGREDTSADTVKLMTIHASKGLEFPVVFCAGMNEGVFPSSKSQTPDDMEEERRLCYVAATRAKETLHFTSADGFRGDQFCRLGSRFIADIGASCLEGELPENLFPSNLEARAERSAPVFPVGTNVRHPHFGVGVICAEGERTATVQFDRKSSPLRINTNALTPLDDPSNPPNLQKGGDA